MSEQPDLAFSPNPIAQADDNESWKYYTSSEESESEESSCLSDSGNSEANTAAASPGPISPGGSGTNPLATIDRELGKTKEKVEAIVTEREKAKKEVEQLERKLGPLKARLTYLRGQEGFSRLMLKKLQREKNDVTGGAYRGPDDGEFWKESFGEMSSKDMRYIVGRGIDLIDAKREVDLEYLLREWFSRQMAETSSKMSIREAVTNDEDTRQY